MQLVKEFDKPLLLRRNAPEPGKWGKGGRDHPPPRCPWLSLPPAWLTHCTQLVPLLPAVPLSLLPSSEPCGRVWDACGEKRVLAAGWDSLGAINRYQGTQVMLGMVQDQEGTPCVHWQSVLQWGWAALSALST